MANSEISRLELLHDIEDARRLGHHVFAEEWMGKQIDVSYVPLDPASDSNGAAKKVLEPKDTFQHLLRFTASQTIGEPQASVEIVEHSVKKPDRIGRTLMGFTVFSNGSMDVDYEHPTFAKSLHAMPTVMFAPQLKDCLTTFNTGDQPTSVDADMLLEELMKFHGSKGGNPHVSQRYVERYATDDYDIEAFHKINAIPKSLAEFLGIPLFSAELLHVKVRRYGRLLLESCMMFNNRKDLIAIQTPQGESAETHISTVASFKRSIFN